MRADLTELMALDRAGLVQRWEQVFGCAAPKSCQAPLLRSALAWSLQMKASRTSAAAVTRQLRRPAVSLSPGTLLVREWQGRTHQVTVLASGFSYADQEYRSLSAIARAITGTPWSGPAFFGVRS